MRILFTLTLLSTFLADAAFAGNTNLFTIRKPKNPENLIQTFIPVGGNCALGKIDFYWLMNGNAPKTPNGALRCNILSKLKEVPSDASNKASCGATFPNGAPAGSACFDKFISSDEISALGQKIPLVIRSVKSASKGTCDVAGFVDVGGRAIQVRQINVNGRVLSEGLSGGTFQFTSVEFVGVDGKVANTISCGNSRGCILTENRDPNCPLF